MKPFILKIQLQMKCRNNARIKRDFNLDITIDSTILLQSKQFRNNKYEVKKNTTTATRQPYQPQWISNGIYNWSTSFICFIHFIWLLFHMNRLCDRNKLAGNFRCYTDTQKCRATFVRAYTDILFIVCIISWCARLILYRLYNRPVWCASGC